MSAKFYSADISLTLLHYISDFVRILISPCGIWEKPPSCRRSIGMFLNDKNCSDEQWIIKFSWQEHVAAHHKVNCSCTNQIAQILIVLTVPSRPNKIVQILIVYSLVACFIIWLLIAIPCNISILSTQIRAFFLYYKKEKKMEPLWSYNN